MEDFSVSLWAAACRSPGFRHLAPAGKATRLSVVFDDFPSENATYRSAQGGLSVILSGLKTLVETGEPLALAS